MNLQQFQTNWIEGQNKLEGCIYTITTKNVRYYYTKCYECSFFSNKAFCLLIKQSKNGSQTISKVSVNSLKFTLEDTKILQSIFDGIEIKIIKSLDMKKNRMEVSFIESFKNDPWTIQFQSEYILKKWFHLINKNRVDYQKKFNQKQTINNTHQKQVSDKVQNCTDFRHRLNLVDYSNEKYCSDSIINQALIVLMVKSFKSTIGKLVFQSKSDLLTKQLQIKRMMHDLNEQIRIIGSTFDQRLVSLSSQLERQRQMSNESLQSFQKEKKNYQQIVQQQNKKIDKLIIQNNQLKGDLKISQQKIQQLTKEKVRVQETEQRIKQMLKQIQMQAQSINKLTIELLLKQKQLQSLNLQIIEVKQQLINVAEKKKQLQIRGYFYGDILNSQYSYKQYLKQILQQLQNRQIVGSRLLFRFDEQNKTNFHNYIDNHPHLLVVVHLCNGIYLAAYISDPIYPKLKQISQKSCIISLSQKETFYLDVNKKFFKYDEYFINFGSSEFQIKSHQKKFFSNFGINKSYYQHKGRDINFLLNEGKSKEAEIENYEIFEIFYSPQEFMKKE